MEIPLRSLEERILAGEPRMAIIAEAAKYFTNDLAARVESLPRMPLDALGATLLDASFPDSTRKSVLYLYFSVHRRHSVDALRTFREHLGDACDAVTNALVAIYSVEASTSAGAPLDCVVSPDDLTAAIHPNDPWRVLVKGMAFSEMGRAYEHAGDYRTAHDFFKVAIETSDHLEWTRVAYSRRLATLIWSSGQPEKALEIYQDPSFVEAIRVCNPALRLAIHLSVAKCAIDCKDIQLASTELQAALARLPDCNRDDLDAYATLYTGELAVLKEDYEGAKKLLFSAASRVENLDPPHYVGALEAKIALSHFAFYEGNRALAILIVQKLLQEADEKQCFRARSRLLVLQTCFFVSETPPLRDAFDNIIMRLHLINNPALLMQALGNLYTYSLEFLDDRDSAFMLQRIRNLESVLEKSCFDDLYRSYVTERYEYAIENRLARLAERDGDGHDFEEESETDQTDPETQQEN